MTGQPLDESRRLRARDEALADGLTRLDPAPTFGTPSLVAQTKAITTYPTSAQRFFACTPRTVLGREVEGGAGALTSTGATLLALNLGTAIPPAGTDVLVTFVDSRWVFRFDG